LDEMRDKEHRGEGGGLDIDMKMGVRRGGVRREESMVGCMRDVGGG
jgi:hypothetical protein